MLQLPNPDGTPVNERRTLRIESELLKWNVQRYIGDLEIKEDPIYNDAKNMSPHWKSIGSITNTLKNLNISKQNDIIDTKEPYFTPHETYKLATLTTSLIPTPSIQEHYPLLLSLLDIFYAYTYDHRFTLGDSTCESAWTIVILSMCLLWLKFYTVDNTPIKGFQWSIRRALIYPYIRNYDILRCLLHIYEILEKSECYYLLNKLYIGPLIHGVQDLDEIVVNEFVKAVKDSTRQKSVLGKETMGLELEKIEELYFLYK